MAPQNNSSNTAGTGDSIQQPAQDEELAIPNEKSLSKADPVPAGEGDDEGTVYPPTRKVVVVMVSLYLSLFLVSLVSFALCSPAHFVRRTVHELTSLLRTAQ